MNYAIILAGGRGIRAGGVVAKQFQKINNQPVIQYSLSAIHDTRLFSRIIVACNKEYIEDLCQIIDERFDNSAEFEIVEGGEKRGASLLNALDVLRSFDLGSNDKLLIHEAARPGISRQLILNHIEKLDLFAATNTLMPSVDLMMTSIDGEKIQSVLPKEQVYHGQAPQGYQLGGLLRLLERDENRVALRNDADLCSVFLSGSGEVGVVEGSPRLSKITFDSDMQRLREIFVQECREK